LALLLVGVIAMIEMGLYFGLQGVESPDNTQIIFLTMLMVPGLLFICLYSICSGLLHCEKSFFLSGIAPVAFNFVWIGAVWFFKNDGVQKGVIGLSIAVTGAFLIQWLFTVPRVLTFLLKYLTWKECFLKCRLFSLEIRKMIASMSIGLLGVGAAQINSAVDTLFARYTSLEGPAYLSYAIHLQQLPLALFGIGISSALLPPLSRAVKTGDLSRYRELFQFALTTALGVLLPCTIALLVLAGPSVNLVYGRGGFGSESTLHTAYCLWGYGVGLLPMGLTLILTPAFYAKGDYWTPTLASLGAIFLNFCLNILFVCILHYHAASVAYATSLAAYLNAGSLFYKLHREKDTSFFSIPFVVKMILCSLAGLVAALTMEYLLLSQASFFTLMTKGEWTRQLSQQLFQFFIPAGSFAGAFLFCAWAVRVKEIRYSFPSYRSRTLPQ
jgi:putative peptidoglycan lipid II flippase